MKIIVYTVYPLALHALSNSSYCSSVTFTDITLVENFGIQ